MHNVLAGNTLSATLLDDWAPQALSSTCTPAANFTVSSFTATTTAGVTFFSVTLTYSGATITASSSGNITDTPCCTLPFTPPANLWLPFEVNSTNGGVLSVTSGTGVCTLLSMDPTSSIAATNLVGFSGIILTG